MDAISNIDDIISKVHSLGQLGFAITDHNGCSGLTEAYVKLQKYNKKHNTNLKLLFGTELYYTYDVTIKDRSYFHMLFLAKNQQGLENMYKLVSEAHKHYYYKSRIDLDLIKKYSEGLICTSACMGGWLNSNDVDYLIKELQGVFGEDLYLELHTYTHEDQVSFNKKVLEYSNKYNIKTIACCDSHYVNDSDYEKHKLFRGIGDSDEDQYYQSNDFFIQSEEQVKERLWYIPKDVLQQSIDNTVEIFNKCNVDISFGGNNYPKFVQEGDVKPVFLEELRKGYVSLGINRLPKELKKKYDDRIIHEIDILEKVKYMDYLLITKDILDFCRSKNIPIGYGRGSVNGCQCAQLLGITALDSITNGLYFERFANPDRVSTADVDNDVSQERRHEVIDYIKEKYGYVYQCRTFNYMKAKGALRRASIALQYDKEMVDSYSKKLDKFSVGDDEEEHNDKELQLMMLDSILDGQNQQLIDCAKQLVGILVGFGKHASCVIVSNQEITKFCSLEMQKDSKTKEDVLVASCNFKYLEQMGLLKEDILGLRTTDVVAETLSYIDDKVDCEKLPWVDTKTTQLLQQGDTLGVFQMASGGMTDTIIKVQPRGFVDLIAVVALYRPACILTGVLQEYIDRRNGKPYKFLDDRLKDVLKDTYGLMIYQEDIMRVVQVIGGYSMAEADTVRRAIGKKDHNLMNEITKDFVDRAVANGTKETVAREILDSIIASGSYAFNKSHSQSYGYMSWVTAYLKAHYPLPFYVANINSQNGQQDKILPFIQEVKRKGHKILPVDLRHSDIKWTIEGSYIRMGLMYIKGIGHIEKPKEYTVECIYRTYNKGQLEALVKSGALDFLGKREHLFDIISLYKENFKTEEKCLERMSYFSDKLQNATTDKQKQSCQNKINEWKSKLDDIRYEKSSDFIYPTEQYEVEVLGFTLNDPLEKYDTSLDNGKNVRAFIVTKFSERNDRNGNIMANIETHLGNKYVMFHRNFCRLEEQKGYYFALQGNIVIKTKELCYA